MLAARSCISWLAASAGSERADPVERALRRRRPPSSPPPSVALVGLDPLPLAVDVRRRPRLRVAEDVRVAADDLRGDRRLDVGQVEDALLGRELGVEHDLEQQVAELLGELRRRAAPRARRRPRRPPRAGGCGATRGSARDPTGSRRAARSRCAIQGIAHGLADGQLGRERARGTAARRGRRPSARRPSSRPPSRTARPVVRGIEPAQHGRAGRVRPGPCAARQRATAAGSGGRLRPARSDRERHDQERPRRLDAACAISARPRRPGGRRPGRGPSAAAPRRRARRAPAACRLAGRAA